jgi:hemolysin activation/secretion protein
MSVTAGDAGAPAALINGWPGVRITDSAIEEIGGNSGRFRLVLSLKTWHVYAWAGMDNLGSAAVGPWQAYATGAFNSYLTPGDTLALNLSSIANDPRELGFGRLSYDAPVGTDGWRLGASALYSEVRPGDDRRLTNDNSRTETFEPRSSFAAVQSQRLTLTVTAAAGWSNVSESDVFGPMYNDHIRTASLTADYRLQDAFGGTSYATMTFRQGLDIFGASHLGDDNLSRDGASADFSVLNVYFTRYQTLSENWSAKFAMASQTASGPLFTSQQFYLGGAAFGRGYGAAEISGDNGLAGSFELRFDQREFPLPRRLSALRLRRCRRGLERRLPRRRWPRADLGRRRHPLLLLGRFPGRSRRRLPAQLPRARQHHAHCALPVLGLQRAEALPGTGNGRLPVSGTLVFPRCHPRVSSACHRIS